MYPQSTVVTITIHHSGTDIQVVIHPSCLGAFKKEVNCNPSSHGGDAVARQPEEPSYNETTVVFVIVVVIVTPRWDSSYPIAPPLAAARRRDGIQSEGRDAG